MEHLNKISEKGINLNLDILDNLNLNEEINDKINQKEYKEEYINKIFNLNDII